MRQKWIIALFLICLTTVKMTFSIPVTSNETVLQQRSEGKDVIIKATTDGDKGINSGSKPTASSLDASSLKPESRQVSGDIGPLSQDTNGMQLTADAEKSTETEKSAAAPISTATQTASDAQKSAPESPNTSVDQNASAHIQNSPAPAQSASAPSALLNANKEQENEANNSTVAEKEIKEETDITDKSDPDIAKENGEKANADDNGANTDGKEGNNEAGSDVGETTNESDKQVPGEAVDKTDEKQTEEVAVAVDTENNDTDESPDTPAKKGVVTQATKEMTVKEGIKIDMSSASPKVPNGQSSNGFNTEDDYNSYFKPGEESKSSMEGGIPDIGPSYNDDSPRADEASDKDFQIDDESISGASNMGEQKMGGHFTDDEDSHFFAYFLTIMVTAIIFYLVFHNKQRIIALIIEGRATRNGRGRRNSSKAKYHKLDNNLEEAITATKGSNGF